ncbi:MAG: phosphoribosyltransferase family protein [Bacteroidota bacterium]
MASVNNDNIELYGRPFSLYLPEEQIRTRVQQLGQELHHRLSNGNPTFVVMLKGAFIFAADLIRASHLNGEVCMVRTSSYHGTETEGKVRLHLAPEPDLITDRDVILIEDIVDSGLTMQAFLPELERHKPRSITLVTLLHKPEAARVNVKPNLVGFVIPPKFVVGYGLDYDGLGRQLPAIYQLKEEY